MRLSRPWTIVLLLAALLTAMLAPPPARAFDTPARAAVVVDYRTKAVLFAKEADTPIPPASMSKLMTAYLVFERLEAGTLRLDDRLLVSEKAWRITGSEMFLKVGERVRVADLLRGLIVQSGNDACIVFAEALAGSEAAFARAMSDKARELGLSRSHFANATGLPDPQHYMSVRDLATLAGLIIARFPQYYPIYGEKEFTYADIRQPNRNPLLQANVPGVDGMKTGYTAEAGYGLVASAEREGRRLIMVIAGLKDMRSRATDADRLLEYAFREFQNYRLFQAGQPVVETAVWQGEARAVPLVPEGPIGLSLTPDARKGLSVKAHYDSIVPAPVAKGQRLGDLEIAAPGMEPWRVPLVAGTAVPRAGVLGRLVGKVDYLVRGAG